MKAPWNIRGSFRTVGAGIHRSMRGKFDLYRHTRSDDGRDGREELTPEDILIAREEPIAMEPIRRHREESKLLRAAIEQLPERDRETMLLTLEGKNQTEIAQILGVSQPAVWTRLRRAHKRLLWLATVGVSFSAEDLGRALSGRMQAKHVELMVVLWETTSRPETMQRLRISHDCMRRRFKDGLSALEQIVRVDPSAKRFLDGLRTLRKVEGGRPMRFRGVARRVREAS